MNMPKIMIVVTGRRVKNRRKFIRVVFLHLGKRRAFFPQTHGVKKTPPLPEMRRGDNVSLPVFGEGLGVGYQLAQFMLIR